jgi:hypothetical protein
MLRSIICIFLTATALVADDFRPLVQKAIQRGDKRIVIPPGNYRIDPKAAAVSFGCCKD